MLERVVDAYLRQCVKRAGGEVRKAKWIGRNKAPDLLVLLPGKIPALVELKSPDKMATFPSNAHERAQLREHNRLRRYGVRVEVIGTFEQVDTLLA